MYVIKRGSFILIPLAYNEFCNDIKSLSDAPRYEGEVKINRIIDGAALDEIVKFCNKESNILYVIDMKNIVAYEGKIFKKLLDIKEGRVLLVNIGSSMTSSIKEDLSDQYIEIDDYTLCSSKDLQSKYEELREIINGIYHEETVAIVQWMKQCVAKDVVHDIKPLDSSGVYCNMYINAKKLFLDPEKYYFIVYRMICMMINKYHDADALVSASRNGANLASIIGWLLNKKVIHCTNLGPKFALSPNMIYKDIRKNNKYIYIFDFMCLGTELKLLNALLNSKGAHLVNGFGIANYISLDEDSKFGLLSKMNSLVDVQKEKIGYRIAGSKAEIEEMLIEESEEYGSGLCRI